MDVFLVSGAPMAMSSRMEAAPLKPAVFQKPHKKVQLTAKFLKKPSPKKKQVQSKATSFPLIRRQQSSTPSLLVKIPSLNEVPEPSQEDEEQAEEEDSSVDEVDEDDETEEEEHNSYDYDDENLEQFSGSNSPWIEPIPQEQSVIIDENDSNDLELSKKSKAGRRTNSPQTMVQQLFKEDLADSAVEEDKSASGSDNDQESNPDDEVVNDAPVSGSDEEESSASDDVDAKANVLASAIAGNKKRLAKLLDSNVFYENALQSTAKMSEEIDEKVKADVNEVEQSLDINHCQQPSLPTNDEEIEEEEEKAVEDRGVEAKQPESPSRRTISAISSSTAVTLPSSCPFTPDNDDDIIDETGSGGYGDILNVLERLEAETNDDDDDKDSGRPQSEQNMTLRGSSSTSSDPMSPKRATSVAFTSTESNKEHSGSKLSDLMRYLDNVEKENCEAEDPSKQPLLKRSPVNSKIADLACESSNKLAEEVVNLEFVVEEKERAIQVLRQAVEHQRRLSANFSHRFQKELKNRLAVQKSEYEAAIHRHQNFIDQLIEDKKTLAERCDTLTLEMSNTDRKCQESLKSTEQRHSAEIRRLKSLQETSNKLKQEKWVDEKTRRIKEQTVRGLEPEIQRLLARHNAELADLEAERERRLNAQERELHQRHLQHIRELRTQWEDENAEGWIHERQLLNQRHSQQTEELTIQHQDEVERLQEQLRRERVRCSDDRAHYENEANLVRKISTERALTEIERIREEEETKRKVLTKKHVNEISSLKENEASERSDWERNCRQRLDEEWKQQEDGLRDKFRKERDSELDRVVQKLEAEVITGRKEVEAEFQERIRRIRSKYEAEMEDNTKEMEVVREKWTKCRDQEAKKEEELIVANALLKQKEVALNQALEANARFEAEREDVRKAVRGEFATAMESLTVERTNLLNQLSELRLKLAEVQSEKEAAENQWRVHAEEEAAKIHTKVKAAIQKKEDTICDLQRNYDRALTECQHLETLLQRQTKQSYLSSNTPKATKPGRK